MHRKSKEGRIRRPKALAVLVAVLGMIASAFMFASPALAATPPTKIIPNHVTFTQGVADSQTVHDDATPSSSRTVDCQDPLFPIADCFGHILGNDEGLTYTANAHTWTVFTDGSTPVGNYQTTLEACGGSGPTCIFRTFTVYVVPAPQISVNPTPTIFHAGSASVETATITSTTADNAPSQITCSDCGTNLPAGITFSNTPTANPGLAYFSGKANATDQGTYTVHLTATSDESHNGHGVTNEAWTIQVYRNNAISPTSATFVDGTAHTQNIAVVGYPYVTSISCADCLSTLPSGLSFTDKGNGTPNSNDTAKISGTPGVHTGGVYTVHITLHNGVTADTTIPFTVTVNEAPAYSCGGCFFEGAATGFSFGIGHVYGYPLPSVSISNVPSGITVSTSPVAGTQDEENVTLSGSCTHCGGLYTAILNITNGSGTIHPTFTFEVKEAPFFSNTNVVSWTALNGNSSTITTSGGYPTPAVITETGAPSWVTFTDNGDGTATVSGTPPVSASGYNTFSVQICNNDSSLCRSETYYIFVRAPQAPIPNSAPTSDGQLNGVSPTTAPGSNVSWSGSGFAPYAPVTVAFYPTSTYSGPVVWGTWYANSSGVVSISGNVPSLSGLQYVVAGGYQSDGTVQYLTNQTNFTSGVVFGF